MIDQTGRRVVINDRLRISFLTPTLIRVEEKGPNGFENRPTFLVPERSWPGAEFDLDKGWKTATIRSDRVVITCPKKAQTISDVTFTDPASGEVLWSGSQKASGQPELVRPQEPGKVWALADDPRLVPPEWGACPPPADLQTAKDVSGWDLESGAPDVYVFLYNGDYEHWRSEFLALTGRIVMPPLWAFGYWNSLYYPYTEAEALRDIDEHRKRDYPLDVFVVDTDWRVGGSGGYDVETNCFPDMRRFMQEAHQRNVKVVFNDHPQPNGMKPLEPAMLKFRYDGLTRFLDMGLDAWWYDKNWHEIIDGPVEGIDREVWGQYLYYSIVADERPDERTMVMSMRSWHPASHRFPIWWTGDIPTSYAALGDGIRDTVEDGVNLLMPYVNQDLGGHLDQPDDELYVRFLQYGCLSPITRVHGTRKDGLFRYPWLFGEDAADIIRRYVKLRYRLLPTIYTAARRAYDDGTPVLRKCTLEWPGAKGADNSHQYLFGDDLLIAPVYKAATNAAGTVKRRVWLPAGEWENLWTGEIMEGEKTVTVEAALHQAPAFVRRGGIIIAGPEMDFVGQKTWDPITLDVFAPVEGRVTRELYEDDGTSFGYQKDEFARTKISAAVDDNRISVSISASSGTFPGKLRSRTWYVRVHLRPDETFEDLVIDDEEAEVRVIEPDNGPIDMILTGLRSRPPSKAGSVVEIIFQMSAETGKEFDIVLAE